MASPRTPMSLRAHNREILAAFLEDGVDIRVRLSGFSMKPLVRSGSVLRFSARRTPRVVEDMPLRTDGHCAASAIVRVPQLGYR